jgi:hypothetical protein
MMQVKRLVRKKGYKKTEKGSDWRRKGYWKAIF